jgi:hypothetical protein
MGLCQDSIEAYNSAAMTTRQPQSNRQKTVGVRWTMSMKDRRRRVEASRKYSCVEIWKACSYSIKSSFVPHRPQYGNIFALNWRE